LARAINIMSDDFNLVKYKRTLQRRMQQWPHKLDRWWSHHTETNPYKTVLPIIEIRIVKVV